MKVRRENNYIVVTIGDSDKDSDWIKSPKYRGKTARQRDLEAHRQAEKIHAERVANEAEDQE